MYASGKKTQLDIAAHINVSLPLVHRHLVAQGLHTPKMHGATAYRQSVSYALEMYGQGVPVASILEETGLVVSELYKALHRAGIPLRAKRKRANSALE
jgi:hypothetical protein